MQAANGADVGVAGHRVPGLTAETDQFWLVERTDDVCCVLCGGCWACCGSCLLWQPAAQQQGSDELVHW